MRTHSDNPSSQKGRRLDDLRSKTADLERELDDVRMLLKCELARGYDEIDIRDIRERIGSPDARTETLVTQGRLGAYKRGLSNRSKLAIGIALLAAVITILVIVLSGGGASWPASVATVQSEITRACQNPDVMSEPGQVELCLRAGHPPDPVGVRPDDERRQPGLQRPGRTAGWGWSPSRPTRAGRSRWSLNLHHPYNPFNPIDSLEVAARAINSIIGGATVTGSRRQPGGPGRAGEQRGELPAVHRFGRADLARRLPERCAPSRSSALAGEAALVADVYQKWIVGATPSTAQDAAVLFENSNNPGQSAGPGDSEAPSRRQRLRRDPLAARRAQVQREERR